MKINWGTGIVISFVIFAALLAVAMFLGARQRVDLVTPDYYEEEIRFQDKINQRENANELGKIDVSISKQQVIINFPFKENLNNITGTIQFYKPDNANFDFEEDLILNENGQAIINRENRIGGMWKLIIHAELDEVIYYWEESIRM